MLINYLHLVGGVQTLLVLDQRVVRLKPAFQVHDARTDGNTAPTILIFEEIMVLTISPPVTMSARKGKLSVLLSVEEKK